MLINALSVFTANYLFILSLIIALIYFLRQPRSIKKEIVILSVISVLLILLLGTVGGHLYNNPRPFVVEHFTPLTPHAPDNGFPSDHVLMVGAIAAVFMCFNRRVAIALWTITVLIAVARVYVGVHHPIDVIGSIVISLFGTGIAYACIQYVKRKRILAHL